MSLFERRSWKCYPQEWRREELLVKSSRNGRWVQLKKWHCQWPAVAMLFSSVQVKAILRRMLVTQPHTALQSTAGLGQRVITLSVTRLANPLSHLHHKISLKLTHRDQGMGHGVTNWSPPGSWCLVSLSAALSLILLFLLMLILWLLTCHYPSCPSPAHSRACSGPRPSPAARQHSTHCSLTHRAAHAVLSLWQNHLTTSKVHTWISMVPP